MRALAARSPTPTYPRGLNQRAADFPVRCLMTGALLAIFLLGLALGVSVCAADIGEARAAYEKGDFTAALRAFRALAGDGDADAQYNLGLMYANGQGVAADFAEAARWYRMAAEQGHPEAQTNLGFLYRAGKGVAKDDGEALKWYRAAAEARVPLAQYNLGLLYAQGAGVPQDFKQAAKWYKLAAEQDMAEAHNNLGFMYANGRGVRRDLMRAHMYYNLAAARLPPGSERDTAQRNREALESRMTPAQIEKAQKMAREWRPRPPKEPRRRTRKGDGAKAE